MKIKIICAAVFILASNRVIGQVSTPFNTFAFPTDFVGWNVTAGSPPLNIKTELAQPIKFYTSAGNGTFNNLRMIIYDDNPTPFNAGYVGIGIPVPNFRLDVKDDINLVPSGFPDFGYRWLDSVILKTNFVIDNIFLGNMAGVSAGAGTANTFLGAFSGELHSGNNGGNTFVGWNAGSDGNNVGESVFVGSRAGEFNNGINNSFVGVLAGNGTVINVSKENSFFGRASGNRNTGNENTFLGNYTGQVNESDRNTFVGFSSGQNNLGGRNNVFIGANTGNTNTTGSNLAFFGYEAGYSNINGAGNTFVGSFSGWSNATGSDNSFNGFETGYSNLRGTENVFSGSKSGYSNKDGSQNTFTGFESGFSNITENQNSYYGYLSGRILINGTKNTFIGSQAGSTFTDGTALTLIGAESTSDNALTNASAIGSSAHVTGDDQMILGNNDVNVGIGLSGNPIGPQTKLEIDANIPDVSGLRFRTLTSASPSTLTGVTSVLTVNNSGDVVLGDIPGSGGSIGSCSPGLSNVNFITKISGPNEICSTIGIFEDVNAINTIGLGVGSSVNNSFQVHTGGDLLIQPNAGNPGGDIYMQPLAAGTATQRVFAMYGSAGTGVLTVGPSAGNPVQSGSSSADGTTFVGMNSGNSSQNALNCTFVGANSGSAFTGTATSGSGNNTFVGTSSGAVITGNYNTCLGSKSGATLSTGDFNVLLGGQASGGILSGNDNVLIGYNSNLNPGNGDFNVMLGSRSHGLISGAPINNSVSIGYFNRVSCDNCVSIASHVAGNGLPQQQVGIGFSNPSTQVVPGFPTVEAKLYVSSYDAGNDAAYFAGDVYGAAFNVTSDSLLKENIQSVNNPFSLLNLMEPKTYTYKTLTYPNMGLPDGQHYGFIAQDVEAVAPGLVSYMAHPSEYDSSGNILYPQVNFRTLNYTELIPVLVAAVKEQKNQLDSLMFLISQCCNSPVQAPSGNKSSIPLLNKESILLNQNTPNPFKDQTEISYHIPTTVQNAFIMFYDQSGKILRKFEIIHRGSGSLTVYGDDLSSGVYSYTLMIDGKNHETKRMMKQ